MLWKKSEVTKEKKEEIYQIPLRPRARSVVFKFDNIETIQEKKDNQEYMDNDYKLAKPSSRMIYVKPLTDTHDCE